MCRRLLDADVGSRRARLWMLAFAFLPCVSFGLTVAPDYAREDRWAQETVPAIVTGEAVYLATQSRPRVLAIYTEPGRAADGTKYGVIVVHGLGVHPDWGLINAIRTGLADAGFATLSVQMPVLAADAPASDYPALFAEAGQRLGAALAYFHDRGIDRVAIVSHSMGAAMTNAFLAQRRAPAIEAWVPIGMQGDFAVPPREPVLDITAANDLATVRASAPRRAGRIPGDRCSRQAVIAGADHFMEGHYKELVATVGAFVTRALARDC